VAEHVIATHPSVFDLLATTPHWATRFMAGQLRDSPGRTGYWGLSAMSFVPRAKIAIPQLPPEFVLRAALRADLDAGSNADAALVCAPAGYGKTVVLADWAHSSTGADTAWVSLDRDDNDPRRLWASVVAALAACPSVPPASRLHTPWVWQPGSQPEFLAELTDAVQTLPRPMRLILDDVHELVEPVALQGLQTLMRNRPAGFQLVLSTRLDPPLSLPRLRLAGRLWELRADRLRFSPSDAATLLERSGLRLTPAQVDTLHERTGGWAAGLRLAAIAVARAADRDAFLDQFSGNDSSVGDYLVGEILSRLPEDIQRFLREISVSDPVPSRLAAELSCREEAGSLLDRLARETSLLSATGRSRDSYRIQELLRTYLIADLQRQGPRRAADLHATAARWWADQDRPIRALDHAAQSRKPTLLSGLLRRFAVRLILTGDHGPVRRALSSLGAHATASDPWLALTGALTRLESGDLSAARADLRHVRQCWPSHDTLDLAVLQAAVEQLAAPNEDPSPTGVATDIDALSAEPSLEALARLSRGTALFERDDQAGARAELEAALRLGRRHGFDHLSMQCQVMLGDLACRSGEVRTMLARSTEALAAASRHGWEGSAWSAAATSMIAHAALLRAEAPEAERLAAEGLALRPDLLAPPLRFALQVVHGAAAFDQGHRANGLAELQQARSEFGDLPARAEQAASAAVLEFRAALLLGHTTAARTVYGWLAERTDGTAGPLSNAELLVMSAWAESTGGRHEHARTVVRPVLDGSTPALLPHTLVDAWLLETTLAVAADERPAARRALQSALALAEPLDALRPFVHAGPGVRELLVHQLGSFGTAETFAQRALAAGARGEERHTTLSERELTVLGLLPSMLSLDEIATDLTVSVNTVKSHVRSIYTKLGVSSRRTAVLSAHESGLLASVHPS
jgi:LuxR family transcriptional regulator, maltose regulon positive regulatory protein